MNILLVGSEAASLQTFKRILKAKHHVTAVLSAPAPYEFRGASLVAMAEKEGVPVWSGTLVKDPQFAEVLRSHHVDILLNVNSLYRVCPEVLEAPRIGAFNFHPSLLPRYAGLNAPSWAVFYGEQSHGVTIHWMVPKIDAGAIAYQIEFPIDPADTCARVSYKCVTHAVSLLECLLEVAAANPDAIPRIPQDLTQRKYFHAGPPDEGCIRWARPAWAIVNFLRACEYRPFPSPWGRPRTTLRGREIGLVDGRSTHSPTDQVPGTVGRVYKDGVEIACADEWLLVTELFVDGSYLPAAEHLSPGVRLEDIVTSVTRHE